MLIANQVVGKVAQRTYVVRMLSGIGRWLRSAWRRAIGRARPAKLRLVGSKPVIRQKAYSGAALRIYRERLMERLRRDDSKPPNPSGALAMPAPRRASRVNARGSVA